MKELEFKGTKVEWKHHDKAKGNIVANNRLVANCMGYTTNQDNGEHITESLANAQLIAAAPEMLEALQEIAKGQGAYDMDQLKHASNCIQSMKDLAKEAIKKALNP